MWIFLISWILYEYHTLKKGRDLGLSSTIDIIYIFSNNLLFFVLFLIILFPFWGQDVKLWCRKNTKNKHAQKHKKLYLCRIKYQFTMVYFIISFHIGCLSHLYFINNYCLDFSFFTILIYMIYSIGMRLLDKEWVI